MNQSRRRRVYVVLAALAVIVSVVAAVVYMATGDGISLIDEADPTLTYLAVFVLVALDGVMPIFPAETTLNTVSTAAAQGLVDLGPVIVMGALGAIVGDSALFWLARMSSRRVEPQLARAKSNPKVRETLDIMNASAPALIIGGRYVPGLRFVVNATMGLSTITYSRFLAWSVVSGVLWSVFTCLLAYWIGLSIGQYPLGSIVISGLVTSVVIAVVFLSVRRHRRRVSTGVEITSG